MSCINIFRSALIGLLWFGALTLLADTHYVSLAGTNDSGHNYDTWSGAATNIQWAVDAAATTVDTVLVSNGTYNLTNQISIVSKDITVRSLYGTNDINTSSIINGNYPDYSNRCVYMLGSAAIHPVLDGFIISNGYRVVPWLVGAAGLGDSGGGVQIDNGGYLLNSIVGWNKTFNSNVDYAGGGGIYLRPTLANYHVIVSNCYVVSNTVVNPGSGARAGGGILAYYAGGKIIACRISGNQAYNSGGLCPNGCIVSNCIVEGNLATGDNGGIYAYGSTIVDCVISNNVASNNYGGIGSYYAPKVLNSIIIGNRANNSYGGVYMGGGILSNCQVIANVASNDVGGVYFDGNWEAGGVVADCIIAGNVSKQNGGGLYVSTYGYVAPALIKNCLIYGNTNRGAGGGGVLLELSRSTYTYGGPSLINCTIANNEAGSLGGGLRTISTNIYIKNCIIYGNVTTNTGDNYDEVYNATAIETNNYWYNCTPTNLVLAQGNTTNNPLFINAGNRNYRLGGGSPCINTGTNIDWMTNSIDLDRRIRIRYGTVDMGAYEAIYNGTMYGVR